MVPSFRDLLFRSSFDCSKVIEWPSGCWRVFLYHVSIFDFSNDFVSAHVSSHGSGVLKICHWIHCVHVDLYHFHLLNTCPSLDSLTALNNQRESFAGVRRQIKGTGQNDEKALGKKHLIAVGQLRWGQTWFSVFNRMKHLGIDSTWGHPGHPQTGIYLAQFEAVL